MINFGPHFKSKPHRVSLRFPRGLGLIVAKEVKDILDDPFTPHAFTPNLLASSQSVIVENASLRTLGELCLRTTTAKDIIWHLGDTRIFYPHEISKAIKKIPWQSILPKGGEIDLRVSSAQSHIYHSGVIAQCAAKSLDAVGITAVAKGKGIATLDLTLKANRLSLGLSLAGKPLNHRGYRNQLSHRAPLNECLAASVIRFAQSIAQEALPELKERTSHIHVPFAGSGTFGFEAILRFGNIAPCVFRKSYAAEQFLCVSHRSLLHTRSRAYQAVDCQDLQLSFSDIDSQLCADLKSSADEFCSRIEQSELQRPLINVIQKDFFLLHQLSESNSPICLLLNPPYGQRLRIKKNFFSAIGKKVSELSRARNCPVWGVALLPKRQAADAFRAALCARVAQKIALRNGGLAVEAIAFVI